MPSNTTYIPLSSRNFEADKLRFNSQGISATITANSVTNLDYLLTDDCLITGAWIIINNGNYGDFINMQVVDTDGLFSPPGTVLNQFATNWFLPVSESVQLDMAYPAKIPAGLSLRIIYHSTGANNTFVAINYKLHKILI